MTDKTKTSNRRWWLLIIFVIMPLGICAILSFLMYLGSRIRQESLDRFGATIVSACDPIRDGQAKLTNLPDDSDYPLQVVVFREGQSYVSTLHNDIRDEWRAENGDVVDIVVCVGEEQHYIIEECAYGDENDDPEDIVIIRRYQRYHELFLLNPVTLERIIELEVSGALPDECPDQIVAENGTEREINGDAIRARDLETVLQPYLEAN